MPHHILKSKRSIIVYTFAYALSSLCLTARGQTSRLKSFDFREYIGIINSHKLKKMGLSPEEITIVKNIQKEIISQSFENYEQFRKWISNKVHHEYLEQNLVVYQRCILSNSELTLLILNLTID